MRVHLLSLSLVGFTLEETIEVPSIFNSRRKILTPLPLRYMLSLINHFKKLPIGDSSRIRVEKDLLDSIHFYILPTTPGEALWNCLGSHQGDDQVQCTSGHPE